jgi:hypothetical protein
LTLLVGGSFSQLVFGSVPDHFAVSGCLLAISYLVAAGHLQRGGPVPWRAWLACGILATSVTVTNLVSIGILFATTVIATRTRDSRPIRSIVLFLALVCGMTYTLALLGYSLESAFSGTVASRGAGLPGVTTGEQQEQTRDEISVAEPSAKPESHPQPDRSLWRRFMSSDLKWMNRFWEADTVGKLGQILPAIANTLAPAGVNTKNNVWGQGERYNYQFTLEKTSGTLPTVLAAILLATGTLRCLNRSEPLYSLAVASLGILAFNFLLHTVWGQEYFLYSQHWLIALLVLLAGNLACEGKRLAISTAALGILVVCVMANNALLIQEMFRVLVATP